VAVLDPAGQWRSDGDQAEFTVAHPGAELAIAGVESLDRRT
jgi:hypothetical protein